MKKALYSILVLLSLSAGVPCSAQEAVMGVPPKEIKNLAFLIGEFQAELTMYQPGMAEGTPLSGTVVTKESLGGMWIESRHEGEIGGMKVHGLELTSYDPEKKKYLAYWYDSMAPATLELWGELKNGTLVLQSEATEFPGIPGKFAYRATYTAKAGGDYMFKIESGSDGEWTTMLEGTMKRKKP